MKRRTRRRPIFPEFVVPEDCCNLPLRRCPAGQNKAHLRIVIMRVGAHGDVLMGTPLLRALRNAYPNAHLTWIVEWSQRQAIDAHPLIDEVIIWDSLFWKRLTRKLRYPLFVAAALRMRRLLREKKYDIFISFQPEEWPLLLSGIAAKTTIGVFDTFRATHQATRTSPYFRLYQHAYAESDLPPHRADQYLLPLHALGLPQPDVADKQMTIGFTADDVDKVKAFLATGGIREDEEFLVIAPFATWETRCWPMERFAALHDLLTERQKCRIVVVGSDRPFEQEGLARLAGMIQHTKPLIAAGVFGFRQMAALIARATLLIGEDSGPLHVAAAVGTPYLSLFGPTPTMGRAPHTGRGLLLFHPVPCGPCDLEKCPNTGEAHMQCMRLISVDEVFDAANRLLVRRPQAKHP